MKHVLRKATVVAALVLLAACGGTEEEAEVAADAATPAQAAPGDTGGMAGMAGMQDDGMMQQMQSHMQMMTGMSPDSMRAMMPQHRQMAANMLAQMNRDMQQMNMTSDEAWTATVDSLRQDLTRMPELSAEELGAFMPGHHTRMMRLMEMHRGMMGNMQM